MPAAPAMSAINTLPPLPALVPGVVQHQRLHPITHRVRMVTHLWLVDLPTADPHRFRGQDHFETAEPGSVHDKLLRVAARHGLASEPGDRHVMLAAGRSLRHVFNPLSVHWCLAHDGTLRWAVLEVHNTYGERHAYLLDVDASGRARTDKAFYVSPFNDTEGEYAVSLRLDPERVTVTVGLDRDGARVLTATTTGVPRAATDAAVVGTALRHLLMTWRVSALIRIHGIRLWARRLPIQPRTPHPQEHVR